MNTEVIRKSGKWSMAFVVALILGLTMFSAWAEQTVQAKKPTEILLLHSYHQGLSWSDNITAAVEASFADKPVSLNVEYLDSKRHPLNEVSENVARYLALKYAKTPPKIIIAADNNALTFLRNHRGTLFPEALVVFSGINNYTPQMLEGFGGKITGVVEKTDPAGTLRLIQRLQPGVKRVAVIAGDAPTGQLLKTSVEKELAPFANTIQLEWWHGLSMAELLERCQALSPQDAILLTVFNRDSKGQYFSYEESAEAINSASAAPVYGLWDFYIGTGVIGGRMASGKDQGEVAAQLSIKYLNTGQISDVIETSPNTAIFSYPDMVHHGLNHSSLPHDALVLNRPATLKNNPYLFIAIAALSFVAIFGVGYSLIVTLHRRESKQYILVSFLRNNTIAVLGITIFSILLVLSGQKFAQYHNSIELAREELVLQKKQYIQYQIDRVISDIDFLRNSSILRQTQSKETLQELAKQMIGEIRYDNGNGYLFVMTDKGVMLEHPIQTELVGTDISQQIDINGFGFGKEMIAAAHHPDGKFISYFWPKPGSGKPVQKLSYAKAVPGWDWVIASGIYMDDIEISLTTIREQLKNELIQYAATIFVIGLSALFLLLIVFRYIASQVTLEIKDLQTAIAQTDPTSLSRRFSIKEFQSIAGGAIAAFKETEYERQKFKIAFQNNVAMMVISSLADSRLLEVNESFLKTLKYTEEEVIGKTLQELVWPDPEVRKKIFGEFSKTGDTGIARIELRDNSGNTHFVEFRGKLIELDAQKCMLSVMHDITERIRAEEQIFQLSRAIEQSPVSVVITDLDGRIEYVNPKFCNITGYSLQEAIGKNPRILKSGKTSDISYGKMWSDLSNGLEWRGEFYNKRKNGTHFWESATISPLRDAEGKISHYLAVKEDITEKKSLEGQLVQAQKLESVGQLAAGIAHEINTPIQFIGDNLRFMQDTLGDLLYLTDQHIEFVEKAKNNEVEQIFIVKQEQAIEDADIEYLKEEFPKAIEQSQEGADRVSKIVRAMKEFSHPGSTDMSSANLNQAIETTITVAKNEWKYVATVEADFATDLPAVPCLVSEFNQVVLNMIVNARDAITESGKDGIISITTTHDDDWAIILISDNGAGIPTDVRERIFDPFYTTKEVGKGSGQGLAIAHNVIVNKHHGKLTVQSQPGEGTTFEIRLPLKQELEALAEV